jgi:glycosyltransferase involved in cell wall biosynthesis
MRLLAHHDARRFFERYLLVGASSWSPPDYAVFANFAGLSEDPLFIGISNVADLETYAVMAPTVQAVPLMACDWVDASMYAPKPRAERSIDLLMVAHWAPFKRHWLLFEALRKLPRDLRIVLIGRDAEGRTERELRAEARAFGVRQDLEVVKNVSIEEVAAYQCDAKVAVQLSQREGSCVAVTEAMFADTPVAMMRDAHVGAKAHVNAETGRLFSRSELPHGLARMLEGDVPHSPRRWALANITAQRSSERLNTQLRDHELRAGRPWTSDVAPLCWRYVPDYLDPADRARLAPGVDELKQEHGVQLVPFVFRSK